ncbi:protein tyrosine phosphatase family protein [Shewanella sp. NIFS-20-20]|uniref:protein tyrosine phosphatase family protein n=1 Tax=Shewanella sp. NIFS-20-20 TaxID=2853806 RepID=UPI001C44F5B7|nr:protein tyrosine phosphatase family protein [Shewanella sp. NIFS-20-20]MBV7317507.1 protein tyrosine phosphatase family protein [Shewanella sp. NIFS-20-20]
MKKLLLASMLIFAPLTEASVLPSALENITAVQKTDTRVITAGLPKPEEYSSLAQSGVDVVVNLMPDASNDSYQNEAQLVTNAGMEYIYIPVDWQNPTIDDVNQFFAVMLAHQNQDVLVHCKANFRASAFYYLYEVTQLGKNPAESMAHTMAPWGGNLDQYPQWQQLIDTVVAQYDQ